MTTAMTTKSDVTNGRIKSLIEQGRSQASLTLQRLQNDRIVDALVPIGPEAGSRRPEILFDDRDGNVGIEFDGRRETFHQHAAAQFGIKLGIPSAWLRSGLQGDHWQREMIADVMATTLAHTEGRSRLLLRSVSGQVRGVLSDQYRRLNSPVIAQAFARACEVTGAVPYRAQCTDINWMVSAMLPHPFRLDMGPHGEEVLAACMHIRSSDFGAGPLDLSFEILRVVCTNGLIGKSTLRQVHLGSRLPDDLALSDRTFRLDSETQASAVLDVGKRLLSVEYIREQLIQIQKAASKDIEAEEAIDGLVRAKRITKQEAREVKATLIRNAEDEIPAGRLTEYKLAQAVSWIAKDSLPDRKAELECLAGSLVMT